MSKNNSEKQIRDNSRIILGLTGLTGSGCTMIANTLAFNFVDRLKHFIDSFDENVIVKQFESMNNLKDLQNMDMVSCDEVLENSNKKLKRCLEEREIVSVLKRNKDKLMKNNFLFISFSSMVIFFVIKYLENSDESIRMLVGEKLKQLGFSVEEAKSLVADFTRKFHSLKINKERSKRLLDLFSIFHSVRDEIIVKKGYVMLQDFGDCIRKYGTPFPNNGTKQIQSMVGRWLAAIVNKYIKFCQNYRYFVIECFRNPQELYYFREKYSYFYLIAINSKKEVRLKRMEKLGVTPVEFNEIEKREINNKNNDICKLDVIRCIDTADIVMQNNDNDGPDALFKKMLRYTALILEPGSIKPSDDETLMHIAYTLSVKSNCLSRQVGAVIVNSNGYIIGAGWNDVGEGQLSCGIKMGKDYGNVYLKNDNIKIRLGEEDHYICVKNKIKDSLCVEDDSVEKKNASDEVFCPVLHAEENAILQLAKYSSGIIKDGKIYSTTFPCSSCFRKISQVGITKVIYSESYVNPLLELYIRQSIKKIDPIPFEGVKSFSYYKLFKPYYDKKEQQLLLEN